MTSFSNFEVFVIVRELDQILSNGKIANIYQIEDLLVLKINTKTNATTNLIVKNDTRLNLTSYEYPIPKFPNQFILSLRKFLRNRRILTIYQYNFDRIVVIELFNSDGEPWKLVIELFNKGNYLILDDKNIVKIARSYKRFKTRDVLPNREYNFPQIKGKSFLNIEKNDFLALFDESKEEIVRLIARNVNISGLYSEEICYLANLEKDRLANSLNDAEKESLFKALKSLRNQLMFGEIKGQIISNPDGDYLNITPFKLEVLKNFPSQEFNSFNETADFFYSKMDFLQIEKPMEKKRHQDTKKYQNILKSQKEYLYELKEKKDKYYKYGNFIYNNFNKFENLISVIMDAKGKGYDWDEINNKLQSAKKRNFEDLETFEKIIPSTKKLILSIDSDEVVLDLTKTIGENANILYQKGKKIDKKMEGTILAIETTKETLKKLQAQIEKESDVIDFLIKPRKKKWYEKYHWFKTSDNFLVIAGRDASSNEAIYKKHVSSDDLVFHTNFPGSPLAVIQNPENKSIPESSKKETADFVASYSSAWKENWGVVDIFYVLPDQISKTPPSGEFLPKGSFMISGKKNIIKDAKTELVIKLEFVKSKQDSEAIFHPRIRYGPLSAFKEGESPKMIIKPSKSGDTKGKLAREIKSYFYTSVGNDYRKWVDLLSLDEIISILPSGKSILEVQ